MKINERDFENGLEMDIAATHATAEGYGRLTMRKQDDGGHYDIYDLDREVVVAEREDLEQLVEVANQLGPTTFEYDPDNVPTW